MHSFTIEKLIQHLGPVRGSVKSGQKRNNVIKSLMPTSLIIQILLNGLQREISF
jgi:hypothetical protein